MCVQISLHFFHLEKEQTKQATEEHYSIYKYAREICHQDDKVFLVVGRVLLCKCDKVFLVGLTLVM